jgi:NADPH:quinone reductase-like Zn-dependent oxidoreductase
VEYDVAIRWRKWLLGATGLAGAGIAAGMLVLSHDSPCGKAPEVGAGETMQAVAYRCYGSPEVLRLETLPKPVPGDGEVLVRVHAASVNPVDKHYLYGTPYVVRLSAGIGAPTVAGFGTDFSGTVAAVGAGVTRFKPGDAVFGAADGAVGEYLVRRATGAIATKPYALGFDEAAAMPVAAITALQALRDKARVAPGQKVLINGASGGVGTFAVQIAKALGAEVTGVCSTRNVELVRSIGADHVIDYTQEDFTQGEARFDAIIDMVGNHGIGALTGVIKPEGVLVRVGSTSYNPWLQPFASMAAAAVQSLLRSQRIEGILASIQPADLEYLADLATAGKLRAVIDRRYPMAQTADAVRYLETGRARGKIIIDIDG